MGCCSLFDMSHLEQLAYIAETSRHHLIFLQHGEPIDVTRSKPNAHKMQQDQPGSEHEPGGASPFRSWTSGEVGKRSL